MINEPIDVLNQRLKEKYGLFENGQPNWRIVWSEDQFEYRLGKYAKFDESGNYLGESQEEEFQYVPKYRQWLPNMWVLERLVPVPEMQNRELVSKLSYEPVFPYMDNNLKGLPPKWEITELVINQVMAQAAKAIGVKYKDPLIEQSDPKIALEVQEQKIRDLTQQLFGNENDTTDALHYKEGIVVPSTYNDKETVN